MTSAPLADSKLSTPTGLGDNAVKDIEAALNALLADTFALYFKTKNFHWHVSGPHFRDYHLLFEEQAGELIGITDEMPNGCARSAASPRIRSIRWRV